MSVGEMAKKLAVEMETKLVHSMVALWAVLRAALLVLRTVGS